MLLLLLLLLLQPAFVATSSSHLKVGLDWKVKETPINKTST